VAANGCLIAGLEVANFIWAAIDLAGNNNTVSGCQLSGSQVGVSVLGSDNDIGANTVTGNGSTAIAITGAASANTVHDNDISFSTNWGFVLQGPLVSGTHVEHNVITNNGLDGLHIVDGANNTIAAENTIEFNSGRGVVMARGAYANHIEGNIISGNV